MIRVVRENLKFQSGDQTLPGSYCNRLGHYREKVPFRDILITRVVYLGGNVRYRPPWWRDSFRLYTARHFREKFMLRRSSRNKALA